MARTLKRLAIGVFVVASLLGVIGARGEVDSSEQTADYFAELAGYEGEPSDELYDADSSDGTRVELRLWQARALPPVGLVKVIGGGHTVPHPENRLPRFLGRTSRDIDSTAVIWRFFETAAGSGRDEGEK